MLDHLKKEVKGWVNEFLGDRLEELGITSGAKDYRRNSCGHDERHRCRFEGHRGDIGIIACEAGKPFAEKVIEGLEHQFKKSGRDPANKFRLIQSQEKHFSNSEVKTIIDESIRGMDIYVIQDVENKVTKYSVDQNLRALKTAMDAAHRADAHYVTAVIPTFPYARQDKAIGREPFTAANVADELERAHAERVITLDIHNPAIGGFFRHAVLEDLHASKNFIEYVQEQGLAKDLVMCAPDTGAAPRNAHYAAKLGTNLALIWKRRDYSTGEVDEMVLLGDVEGKNVLMVDDMIDTAGTLVKACQLVKDNGAVEVYFAASLPMFNGPALGRLDEAYDKGIIDLIIGTDAIFHGGEEFRKAHPYYRNVSVGGYIAKTVFNINHHHSISALLK